MKIITTIHWDIEDLSSALHLLPHLAMELIRDGRSANPIISAWLASNGFVRVSDGKTGYFLKKDMIPYRLRVARDKLSLAPSSNKGVGRVFSAEDMAEEVSRIGGFLIVFTVDMPHAPVWAIDNSFSQAIWHKSFWNKNWEADAAEVRRYLKDNYERR